MRPRKYPRPEGSVPMQSNLESVEGYITVEEAAEFLCRTVSGIYNLKYRKKIRGYNFGGKLLFKKSELDRCVKSSNKGGF